MFTWLLIFIVVGAVIGFIVKGKDGAAEGAMGGFASFMVIATSIVLPILVLIIFLKACF